MINTRFNLMLSPHYKYCWPSSSKHLDLQWTELIFIDLQWTELIFIDFQWTELIFIDLQLTELIFRYFGQTLSLILTALV